MSSNDKPSQQNNGPAGGKALLEIGCIVCLFFLFAGHEAPGVNEAHYLCKAKHYWNPQWCAGDRFLQSADAHAVFYWTFGWLTRFASLATTAWIGRFLTWGLLAWSWRRLSMAVVPHPFCSLLSAALFLLFLKQYHMAGEWVVGGVEAKGFAYVFIFLGLEAIARNRWQSVFPLFGAAAAFHVIIGGWAVVVGFGTWLVLARKHREEKPIPTLFALLPSLALGFALSLPGLLPCVLLNRGESREVIAEGNVAYVYVRLNHHLVLHRWPPIYIARQALLMLALCGVAGVLTQVRALWRITLFAGGCILLSATGALIDLAAMELSRETSAAILRFYWYRMSDAIVPIGVSLAVTWWVAEGIRPPYWRACALALAILASAINVGEIMWQRHAMHVPEAELSEALKDKGSLLSPHQRHNDWVACCEWIREHTDPHDIFITPRTPESFLWYAERAEVASWKNAPQDARGLVDWLKRFEDIRNKEFLHPPGVDQNLMPEERAKLLGAKYGAKYIVWDRGKKEPPQTLVRVYPRADNFNASFAVYHLPAASQTPVEEVPDGS